MWKAQRPWRMCLNFSKLCKRTTRVLRASPWLQWKVKSLWTSRSTSQLFQVPLSPLDSLLIHRPQCWNRGGHLKRKEKVLFLIFDVLTFNQSVTSPQIISTSSNKKEKRRDTSINDDGYSLSWGILWTNLQRPRMTAKRVTSQILTKFIPKGVAWGFLFYLNK